MNKNRLEAFSDGVLAVIITIMVLELKAPHSPDLAALHQVASTFGCYLISFIYLGIYWNNHHHMLHAVKRVDGVTLWANLHLLFWLSLIPFVSSWMSEHLLDAVPVAAYGAILLGCAFAYALLVKSLTHVRAGNPDLERALGPDTKGKISCVLYMIAIPLAYMSVYFSYALYISVALMWFVPDRRIENRIGKS